MPYCRNCGTSIDTNDKFCPSCGARLQETTQTHDENVPKETPWTAKCPICKTGSLFQVIERGISGGIKNTAHYKCNYCDAFFMYGKTGYKLTGCREKSLLAWQKYHGNTLTTEEWKSIAYMKPSEIIRQGHIEIDISPKSRLTTSLFAIFLGEFGVHRFYIGKKGSAAGMLVLGVVGIATVWFAVGFVPPIAVGFVPLIIVGVWAIVDFIIAVSGHMKDKEGRPIKKW